MKLFIKILTCSQVYRTKLGYRNNPGISSRQNLYFCFVIRSQLLKSTFTIITYVYIQFYKCREVMYLSQSEQQSSTN